MRPPPIPDLASIGFRPASHKAALRVLRAVYFDFGRLRKAEEKIKRGKQIRIALAVYIQTLPYLFVSLMLGRLFLFGVLGPDTAPDLTVGRHFFWLSLGLVVGLTFGLATSLAVGFALGLAFGLAVGFALGLTLGLALGSAGFLVFILVFGFAYGFALGLPSWELGEFVGDLSADLSGVLLGAFLGYFGSIIVDLVSDDLGGGRRSSVVGGLGGGLACIAGSTRLFYFPLHWVLLWSPRPSWFRRLHPVFWDFNCALGFPRLERPLVAYAEAEPEEGSVEIERLISHYSSQRPAALRAKTILIARATARVSSLTELDALVAGLPEGDKGYLAQTREVRERLLAISRQQRYVDAVNRLFFREQALQGSRAEINAFFAQVAGYHEPLATEFRKAAEAWLKLADAQLAEAQRLRQREPTPQIFRAGDPVQRDAEAFVARLDIYGALEHEIMAGPGCPGLLLYGRRRLGKSTILRNLEGFLPEPVMPVVISMQNPRAFTSEVSLAALLAEEIRRVWPAAALLGPEPKDLVTFFQFLGDCNARLEADQRRLVLGIDEFEELDRRIGLKQFTEDFAATLRESVQSHRRIIWVFAGSHHFNDLPNVRWSSYLVSLRTLELPPFTPEETRLLLSQPLKHSRRKEAQAAVAAFGTGFWGEGGMDRIHAEAGGWPHLVQLIASTVVDLCNTQVKARADAAILDEALTKAVVSGDSVLGELMLYRSEEYPAAWSYLSAFRKLDTQPPPEDDALRLVLKRHLLMKETAGGQWKLRVPLMLRWLRERM